MRNLLLLAALLSLSCQQAGEKGGASTQKDPLNDGLGLLGDSCTVNEDCDSGHCHDACSLGRCDLHYCSSCEDDGDCNGGACVPSGDSLDSTLFYLCHGGGPYDLGAYCDSGNECASGLCHTDCPRSHCGTQYCSECEDDGDCQGGDICAGNGSVPYYFECKPHEDRPLGDSCTAGGECAAGFCEDERCSECDVQSDSCGSWTCDDYWWFEDDVPHGTPRYSVCTPLDFGRSCSSDGDCASGICHNEICSQCGGDDDCQDGPCVQRACVGLCWSGGYLCLGSMGDSCHYNADCYSNLCRHEACVECGNDGDCGEGICDAGSPHRICRAIVGDSCAYNDQCLSGICVNDRCAECEDDSDCSAGICATRPSSSTCSSDPLVCQGFLGDPCHDNTGCTSGFCDDGVCSECVDERCELHDIQWCTI